MIRLIPRLALLLALVGRLVPPAHAQSAQPEMRVDLIGPRPYALHGGAGVIIPLGYYARLGAMGAYGVRQVGGERRDEWRADVIARLTLDPFRQQRWGFSLGGGITVRRHAYLLAIADIEGPETRGWLPAFQLGVGGGIRAGLGFRRAVKGRR